jgi:hypothetical protein
MCRVQAELSFERLQRIARGQRVPSVIQSERQADEIVEAIMGPQTSDVERARVENLTDRLEQVVVLPTRYRLVANQRELRAGG